ncbi:MAG: hypothetical protein WCH34_00080 [Bacteroidota bacterium]
MILLIRLFGNFFSSGERMSEEDFRKFVLRHLVRAAHYNTSGQYSQLITSTQTLYEDYYGEIHDEDVDKALKKSLTHAVDLFLTNFHADSHKIHVVIEGVFDLNTAEILEFYPHGNTEYSTMNKTTAETLFNRLKTAVNKYSASFTPAFVTKINNLPTQYNSVRGVQLEKIEDVTDFINTTEEKRLALELQICRNIHDLAKEYLTEPAKGLAFFDLSLVRSRKRTTIDDNEGYILEIPKLSTVKADMNLQYTPDYYLAVANNGTVDLKGYSSATPGDHPTPATTYLFQAGKEVIINPLELGAHGNPYFYLVNQDPNEDGEVSITIVPRPPL